MMRKKKKLVFVPIASVNMGSPTGDPFGSYTGVPLIPIEQPVQDADDL